MKRRNRLSVALDIDDVLVQCTEYAIKLANEKYKFDPPIQMPEVNKWGKTGKRTDVIHEFFKDPEFYRTQPVIEGAKEFVEKLTKITDVYVSTAIPPEFMGIRAEQIMREFPQIDPKHIYMGSSKEKIHVDILFDDAMHNVLNSNARYPILMRRPWNEEATGLLAVNTYDEFLKLVEVIADSYSIRHETDMLDEPSIVVFVGPSGSGKSKIATEILKKTDRFEKLTSYTTVDPTAVEQNLWYNYLSLEKFKEMEESGQMFQSTMYAGHYYGSCKQDIEGILKRGKHVLSTMDISGVMSLKTNFKNVITVYIKRNKKRLLATILNKNSSVEDKVNRIIAIDAEKQNADICDYVVEFNTYEEAIEQLCELLEIEKNA